MLTNETKKAEWKKLIEEQKISGLSKAEFCKRKGIKRARFYYYEGEFRKNEIKTTSDKSSSYHSQTSIGASFYTSKK